MYKGIPGKEPKYKSSQKGESKLPAIVKLPRVIVNANPSSTERGLSINLPVVMAGGHRRQLVITDPSVSSSTATAEEKGDSSHMSLLQTNADDTYPQLKVCACTLVSHWRTHNSLSVVDFVADRKQLIVSSTLVLYPNISG